MDNTKLQEWSKDEIRSIIMGCLEEQQITKQTTILERRSVELQKQILDHSELFSEMSQLNTEMIKNISTIIEYLAIRDR